MFYPRTFAMAKEEGYWIRAVGPKMDGAVAREGCATARDRLFGELPRGNAYGKTVRKGKAKSSRKATKWKEWAEWKDASKKVGGTSTEEQTKEASGRMYPEGANLTNVERNCAVANGPRHPSNKAICWDFNSHGRCRFGNK